MAPTKEDGSSGCGVVIKAVDRKNWITISNIAVPLRACTAMAAEITGVSVLTEVLDLLLDEKFNWENINECESIELWKITGPKDN